MSEQRQISDSSNIDQGAENMDKISSSPTFSTVTAEITTNFDDLMQCDDLLDDEEVNCLGVTDATSCCSMNENGRLTDCSSWCSSSDSDISEVITSLDQNLDEEITKVCKSFLFPENLETEAEDFEEDEEVWTPEPGSSSRHGIRSEEGSTPASSFTTNTVIIEADKMSQVIDKTMKSTDAVKTLVATEPVKTLVATEPVKTLVAAEPVTTLEPVKTLVATEPVKTCQDSPPESDLSSSPVVEEQDVPPEETGNTVPSPPSTSSFPPAHQVDVIPRSQSQLLTRTATDFQDELRNSPSHQSRDSADGILKDVPQGPSEENGDLTFSQKAKEAAADWQLVLDSSHITTLIRTFFQSLCEEQWREVGEGIYNQDVKEQLTDMCTEVLRFISELVAKNVLEATSRILTLWSPLSSAPLTRYFGITEDHMQKTLENSFSQALCDIVGGHNPGKISPKFTEAIAGEVIYEVSSVLSVTLQAALDGGSPSVTAAASCWVPKDRYKKKALEGALTTMKSFLTGRGTAVKRMIQTDQVLDDDSKEETLAQRCEGKRRKFQKRRCFSGWQRRKIQPAPLKPFDEPVRSTSTDLTSRNTTDNKQGSCCSQATPSTASSSASVGADLRSTQPVSLDYVEKEDNTPQDTGNVVSSPMAEVTTDEFKEEMNTSLTHQSIHSGDKVEVSSVAQSQPDSEHFSNNQAGVEETTAKKSNRFTRFFRNIFSKKNEKTLRPPFWMRLLCCSSCSCCLNK